MHNKITHAMQEQLPPHAAAVRTDCPARCRGKREHLLPRVSTPHFQQRINESARCCTGEDVRPTAEPSNLHASLQNAGNVPSLHNCQSPQEMHCLGEPTPANLDGKDDQPSTSSRTRKLRVSPFLTSVCGRLLPAMVLSTANPRRPKPKQSSGRPPAVTGRQGEGQVETAEEQHTVRLGRELVSHEVGQHTNGLDESGPPWDRTRASCGGGNAGNASRKCCSSTVFDAKCCQPCPEPEGGLHRPTRASWAIHNLHQPKKQRTHALRLHWPSRHHL